jgi:hypothetical protein
VPSTAIYPYTVTYQLTIDPGTAGSHCIDTITDSLVPGNGQNLVSSDKPSGGVDCAALLNTVIVAPNIYTCYYDVTFTAAQAMQGSIGNTASMTWDLNALGNNVTSNDSLVTFVLETLGTEGLTPGYWKQPQHLSAWQGYSPAQSFDSVFSVSVFPSNLTLLGALAQGGGGVNALARQAVAALLNATSTTIAYPLYSWQIIQLVHDAIVSGDATAIQNLKDQLQTYNSLSG